MLDSRKIYHYGLPYLEQDDIDAVVEVLKSTWLTTGPKVLEFEAKLNEILGCNYSVACSNGSSALYVASKALDFAEGDVVIVPSITFLATANAPHLAGAKVVFADVCPTKGVITPETFAKAIDRAEGTVRAVFPVHMNGVPCSMNSIADVANQHNITVVEDACHAIGGRYSADGSMVGSCAHSLMSTFSFHPVKNLTTGEGGAVTTNDELLSERLRLLRNHGMQRGLPKKNGFENVAAGLEKLFYHMDEPSLNFRISDISCALGITQLQKLNRFINKRELLKKRYESILDTYNPYIMSVKSGGQVSPAWHLSPVQIDYVHFGTTRDKVMSTLAELGIYTQVHYYPVHKQPYYRRECSKTELPGAQAYYAKTLSLPLHYALEIADVDYICEQLLGCLMR